MSCIMVRDPSNIIRCFQGNSRSECMFSRFHLEDPFCIRSEYINCMKPLSLFFIIVEIRGLWIVDWPTWKTWVFLTFFLTFFLTLTFLRWNRKNHLFLVVYIVILTYLFVHALHFFFFFFEDVFYFRRSWEQIQSWEWRPCRAKWIALIFTCSERLPDGLLD